MKAKAQAEKDQRDSIANKRKEALARLEARHRLWAPEHRLRSRAAPVTPGRPEPDTPITPDSTRPRPFTSQKIDLPPPETPPLLHSKFLAAVSERDSDNMENTAERFLAAVPERELDNMENTAELRHGSSDIADRSDSWPTRRSVNRDVTLLCYSKETDLQVCVPDADSGSKAVCMSSGRTGGSRPRLSMH
eukprot:2623025-Pleurochrysis_carterae.AAC.3